MLQEWRKPFRLPLDNLLEQVALIIMMALLYIDLASPTGDSVSTFVVILLAAIFTGVAARTVVPKYIARTNKALASLPCTKSTAPSEMEEGLYAGADSPLAMGQEENAMHITWAAAGTTTEVGTAAPTTNR